MRGTKEISDILAGIESTDPKVLEAVGKITKALAGIDEEGKGLEEKTIELSKLYVDAVSHIPTHKNSDAKGDEPAPFRPDGAIADFASGGSEWKKMLKTEN